MAPTPPGDAQEPYPLQFAVEYPDRELDLLSTAFRIILAVPIFILLGTVGGGTIQIPAEAGTATVATGAGSCSSRRC